jgi:bifunctional UDP-N-acetylglucosamine pyrophosphorylase/glucosamine-1-phosphate N-acetyltransferase
MNQTPASAPPLHIVILAGGAGKRMKIGHPKALHPVFFRPMIQHVINAAMALPHLSIRLIVDRGLREFREQCRSYPDLIIFRQEGVPGTANALRTLEPALGGETGDVLILNADTVLLTTRSLQELMQKHSQTRAACTAGRATSESGEDAALVFHIRSLFEALKQASPNGSGKNSPISETVVALVAQGAKTTEYRFRDPVETMDINDLDGLWRVETILQERCNRELMLKGVSLQDPRTTLIDPRCRIARDVRIEGGCTVINSVLETGVLVENFCRILNSEVGQGSLLKQGTCLEEAHVGRDCRVGPYARLRPGTLLADNVWIGNFVEVKNASLGSGTRAAHLSFIGDAQIGRNVNIGCGFITCNSNGKPLKQRTIIEDGVFIGSASQAIAPVTLGAGSFIATGTSVTDNVPPDSFVISRGRQVTKPGYAKCLPLKPDERRCTHKHSS